ncbi:histone deacetylase 4-like isoform X2 [Gigantopelta aegis]|uniref:histone deacetylase 4-like isoform X2 n=1 Tax=Gigantopelta aegis TaxID=1735272 RepID=UPI001B88DABB|nr:histone deacetylase 4-like isoform X2 [Gigantopelta aegis]
MTSNNFHFTGNKFYKGSVDSGFQEPIVVGDTAGDDKTLQSPDPVGPLETAMEINSFSNMGSRRGDINQTSPLGSPETGRRPFVPQELFQDQHLQQQLASIKQQQQLQQHFLLQQYEQQRQQLEQEHEKQLHEHIKQQQHKLEQQQRLEKELMEKERLQQIKNKKKQDESAIASNEVKQKVHEFILSKKQREQAVKELTGSPPQFRHPWGPNQGSLDQSSPPANMSPPYPHAILGKYDDDFPLRKTASEPNILKVRSALKQKLETRRTILTHSPLVRRRDKGLLLHKRKNQLSIETGVCSSNPDSGPNSPQSSIHGPLPNGSLTSLHSKEDSNNYPFPFRPGLAYGTDLSLYTSPSMPNISLGRPPTSGHSSQASTSSSVSSEDELRVNAVRLGLPLGPMLPNTLPGYFSALPFIEGEFPPGSSQAFLAAAAAQGKLGSPVMSPYTIPPSGSGLTEPPHPAHRLHRHHRPLSRTQSAPLPLGHPVFQQQQQLLQQQQQQQHEQYMKDQKIYLKQHIRQTVLQRSSSKSHMENVDEEAEVKLAQEMKESRSQAEIGESTMEETTSEPEKQQTAVAHDHEQYLSMREVSKPRHRGPSHHRTLSRTQSSPLVTFSVPPQKQQEPGPVSYTFTTGLAYDPTMLKHECTCGNSSSHLEHSGRIQSIWTRLQECSLIARCETVRSRKATMEELQSCHTELHTLIYGPNLSRQKLLDSPPTRFCLLPCGGVGIDSDTVWNELHTSSAARMAAGCVTELACSVALGDLKNGMAVVRPPGHHAESNQAMGFCFFNSIAIAAKQLREKLKINKVLIVDWDVHHGNGTQQMFFSDQHVLYISIHRHDNGNFFPGTGAPDECGAEEGVGFNVNIAFGGCLNPPMGDTEYLTAFRTIVMPIAREFSPDVILISAGFDAAKGHPAPLGGYEVTAAGFAHMTRELMSLANGKVILVLEGGYDIPAISEASASCVKALLGDELAPIEEKEMCRPSCKPALETLEQTIQIQGEHWPSIKRYVGTLHHSLMEAQKREMEEADTVTALASLSMVPAKRSESVEQETEPMDEGT